MIEKAEQKRKEFLEETEKNESKQLTEENFNREIENKTEVFEKIQIEDKYIKIMDDKNEYERKILQKLNRNLFKKNESKQEMGKIIGFLESDNSEISPKLKIIIIIIVIILIFNGNYIWLLFLCAYCAYLTIY